MADYPDAIEYYVDKSRVFQGQNSCRAIVLHGTGGSEHQTVEQLGEWFRTNPSWVSSHFGIGRDGRIAQYVTLWDGAAANCCLEAGHDPFWDRFNGDNLNIHTISIEHINDATNSLPLTPAQQAASFKLVAWMCNRYGLGPDQVKTHASIAPGSRARCPGLAYPLDELKTFLNGEGTMYTYTPGQGDFDNYFIATDADHWKCKATGAVLQYGNLGLYRSLSMDGQTLPIIGLPLESEVYHLEADGYSWSSQMCERGTIRYDPAHRWDSQPGLGASYLAHVNPPPVQVDEIVKTDIKALGTTYGHAKDAIEQALEQLGKDAGIQ